MSIAEKLTTIASGLTEINNGIKTESELITNLQDVIDNIPDSEGKIYEQAYSKGYENGKDDEYDRLINESKIIKSEVVGNNIVINDVSEIPHKCTITAISKNLCSIGAVTFTGYKACTNDVILPAGNYFFTADVTTTDTDITVLVVFHNMEENETLVAKYPVWTSGTIKFSFTLPEPTSKIYLYASTSAQAAQGKTATYSNIQITSGTTEQPYEPYVTTVTACGKNLFDCFGKGATKIGYYTATGTTLQERYGWELLLPPGTYTFKPHKVASDPGDRYVYGYVVDANNRCVSGKAVQLVANTANYTRTVEVASGEKVMLYNGAKIESTSASLTNKLFREIYNVQCEKGSTATDYEPFIGATESLAAGESFVVDSICPSMNVFTSNGATITFDYHKSWGKQAAYDEFWDIYQGSGTRTTYLYAFAGLGWTDETFEPKYSLAKISSANYMFAHNAITDLSHLPRLKPVYGCGYMFYKATKLKHIGEIEIAADNLTMDYVFAEVGTLETIDLLKVRSNTKYTETFRKCTSLTNITFDGVIGNSINLAPCSKLSSESVDSIIEHLADLTGSTAKTLTLHADVGAKLTDEQKTIITTKNWTLVY